jgi:hypothetical protein
MPQMGTDYILLSQNPNKNTSLFGQFQKKGPENSRPFKDFNGVFILR